MSAFDLPFGPLGGGLPSTGDVVFDVSLDEGRVGGGGAREGRKDVATGVAVGVDARACRNWRDACFLFSTGWTFALVSVHEARFSCAPVSSNLTW